MDFTYDVFVSYSHTDRDWAQKLVDVLKTIHPAYRIFFDYKSIRAGEEWEAEIEHALESSVHLLVLWSTDANASPWVQREIWTFNANAKPKAKGSARRLVSLNLQGARTALGSLQHVVDQELQGLYPDANKLDDRGWKRVARAVDEGIRSKKRPLDVPLVVLTLTESDIAGFSQKLWDKIAGDLRLSRAALASRYGKARSDWRPFARSDPIGAVLDAIRVDIDGALPGHRFEWLEPDASFWIDIDAAKRFVTERFDTADLAVLIIDPVALHDPDVYQRLMLLQNALTNSRTVIITLPPFAMPRRLTMLREALKRRGMPYFDDFFEPTVPPRRRLSARCGWNVSDPHEICRLILAAAGDIAPESPAASSPFLRSGPSG